MALISLIGPCDINMCRKNIAHLKFIEFGVNTKGKGNVRLYTESVWVACVCVHVHTNTGASLCIHLYV